MVSCYRFSPVAGSLNPTAEQAVSGHLQRSKNQLLACVPEKGLFVGRENSCQLNHRYGKVQAGGQTANL